MRGGVYCGVCDVACLLLCFIVRAVCVCVA